MKHLPLCVLIGIMNSLLHSASSADTPALTGPWRSVREFQVLPENSAAVNKANLQAAIDWASPRGAALFLEPSEEPYPMEGGIILRKNVSIIGVHGPVPRGTRHPTKKQPVGSVFRIEDDKQVFITLESASQLKGLQFWYPRQAISNPAEIIAYPPTLQISQKSHAQGITLSNLTFFGEYLAMDLVAQKEFPSELILIEHCYGYPLSGEFIRIDYCYDIPRILHCHVNPALQRFIGGDYRIPMVDSVIARGTFAYSLDHTDNAQLIDVFTFGTYGGIRLGPATYGQLTNFNLDCVVVGIHKFGDNSINRNWQIAQGSIIANAGSNLGAIHPIIVEGLGHVSLSNVEAFSGDNGALSNMKQSQDFLLVKGDQPLTISLWGCRMRNYAADQPITNQNPRAGIQVAGSIDQNDHFLNFTIKPTAPPPNKP